MVARRHGQRVRGITLWLVDGMADLEGDAASPGAEFRMAVAGLSASLGVAAACRNGWLLGVGSSAAACRGHTLAGPHQCAAGPVQHAAAFPLDGGRVLRAALWRLTGDRRKATVRAAWAGRVQGGAVAALGVAGLLFFGWGFSGLWLAVIGTFIAAGDGCGHLPLRRATHRGSRPAGGLLVACRAGLRRRSAGRPPHPRRHPLRHPVGANAAACCWPVHAAARRLASGALSGRGIASGRRASNPALRPAHQRRHVVTGPRA